MMGLLEAFRGKNLSTIKVKEKLKGQLPLKMNLSVIPIKVK